MAYTERFVRSDAAGGGDGTTNTNSGANGAWTLSEALTNATSGMRVNVRAGTYALSANATTPAGLTESPIIWQGFNSSIGDLETVGRTTPTAALNTTDFPLIDGGSSWRFISGAYTSFRNLFVRSGVNNAVIGITATTTMWRCRFENTNTTGGATRLNMGNSYNAMIDCDLVIASNNPSAEIVSPGRGTLMGCRIWNSATTASTQVGVSSTDVGGVVGGNVIFNIGIAVQVGALVSNVIGNTWYNVTTGVFISGDFSGVIANNVGWLHSGFAIRGTASSGNPLILNNAFGSHTSGRLDTTTIGTVIEELLPVTLTADPFTNAASSDFTLNNTAGGGALCRAASRLFGGFGDLGAVQVQAAGSGGVPLIGTGGLVY